VKLINFADENPTVSKKTWKISLETLIAENVDLILVGSTRADDIVRDADILPLYKKAGWQRFLLGLENTDEKTLEMVRKGRATATDRHHWRGYASSSPTIPTRSRCSMSPLIGGHRISVSPPTEPSFRPIVEMGLQASGSRDPAYAALESNAVVQVH
jgi:hypothetical protein